jgi:hypothetical protein
VPTYRLTHPDGSTELLEADSARVEGAHTTLYGTALVIGRPREVVVRRAPASVQVEPVDDGAAVERPSWSTAR